MEGRVKGEGEARRIPWPGPRPYDEHEWRDYFGRGEEIQDLIDRIIVEPLTVLLGASGAGKTSLIRAGVVAKIRNERYRRGDKSFWPVLLLRRWGARRDSSLEVNLFRQLEKAIEPIDAWTSRRGKEQAQEDASLLRSIIKRGPDGNPPKIGFVDLLGAVTDKLSEGKGVQGHASPFGAGLIIVFDQFEELLRSSERSRVEILRIIGDLFERDYPLRILLSMRQEYRQSLRELEARVGGLRDRLVQLEALDVPSLVQVVRDVSSFGGLSIESQVVNEIVEWLGERLKPEEASGNRAEKKGSNGEDQQVGRPDLLRLQAVLVDLCQFAVDEGKALVSCEVLERYVDDRGDNSTGLPMDFKSGKGDSERSKQSLVFDSALERWIESAVSNSKADARSSYAEQSELSFEDFGLQVRRIAVRLAPLLSSADYKVSQEENTLFRQALGEDIAKLFLGKAVQIDHLRILEAGETAPPRLDWSGCGVPEEPPSDRRQFILSGKARVLGWTLVQTGDRILACFKEALERLVKNNILQRTTLGERGEKVYWELVHDQLGPHFSSWGSGQKGSWNDCRSSLVISRGVQPISIDQEIICAKEEGSQYEMKAISWQGCGVAHRSKRRAVFTNMCFYDCFLLGTIFENIDFVGCEFVRCELKGALFSECGFYADGHGKATVFRECHSNVALVGGVVQALEFRDCQLNQPAVKNILLTGSLVYAEGSKVVQGLFEGVRARAGSEARIVVGPDSRAAYCFSGRDCHPLLIVTRQEPDLPNGILPDDFRTLKDTPQV